MDRLGLTRTEIPRGLSRDPNVLGIRAVPTARWASGQASPGGSLLEPLVVVEPRRLFQSSVGGNQRAVARPQPVSSAFDRHPNIYVIRTSDSCLARQSNGPYQQWRLTLYRITICA
jgi:hypothetical protein